MFVCKDTSFEQYKQTFQESLSSMQMILTQNGHIKIIVCHIV